MDELDDLYEGDTDAADDPVFMPSENLGWLDDASCANMELELFFPPQSVVISPLVKATCARCPVRFECLRHVYSVSEVAPVHGFFAGTSTEYRKTHTYDEALEDQA